MKRPAPNPRPAVVAFIIILYVAALTLIIADLPRLLQAKWSDIVIFVVVTTLAELWNVAIGPDSDMSLSFTAHFAAAVLFGPAFAAAVAGVSVLASDGVIRRQPLRHMAFNVASFALAAGVTGLVFDALRTTPIGQSIGLAVTPWRSWRLRPPPHRQQHPGLSCDQLLRRPVLPRVGSVVP